MRSDPATEATIQLRERFRVKLALPVEVEETRSGLHGVDFGV
jgi:hypothetical protein